MSIKKLPNNYKVLVYGGGAVGSYFAGMMFHSGIDVTLKTRGDHFNEIKKRGLILNTNWGEFTINLPVIDEYSSNEFDLIILAVKTYSIPTIIPELLRNFSKSCKILCIQNGLYSYRALLNEFPSENVINGLTYIDVVRNEPGTINQFGETAKIILGKDDYDTNHKRKLEIIVEKFDCREVQFELAEDINKAVWEKLIMVAASGSAMSYAGMSANSVIKSKKYFVIMKSMIFEMTEAALSNDVKIDNKYPNEVIEDIINRSDEIHSSLKEDLDNGRPLELDEILGEAIKVGVSKNVQMKTCEKVYGDLKKFAHGRSN